MTTSAAIDIVKRARNAAKILAEHPCEVYYGAQLYADLAKEVEALRDEVAGYDTLFDLARKRERPWIEAWRKASGKPDTLPDYGEMLNWLYSRIEAEEARVKELDSELNFQQMQEAMARDMLIEAQARVKELEALVKDGVRRGLNCMEWQSRAEAAEDRDKENAETYLQEIEHFIERTETAEAALAFYRADDERAVEGGILESVFDRPATAALATTPAEAIERANLGKELIKVSDAVIDSGRRLRSDPGTHELMLASLCCVMKNLANLDALGKEGK